LLALAWLFSFCKMVRFVFPTALLLISSSNAFVPSVKVGSARGKTSVDAISRRDAFAAGAAALFGVVGGTPRPTFAADEEEVADDISQMAPREFDGRVTINGALVALGYSTLAGSLLLGGEAEDVSSSPAAQFRASGASYDDLGSTVIVQQRSSSTIPTTVSAMDTYVMQTLEDQEEEEVANV